MYQFSHRKFTFNNYHKDGTQHFFVSDIHDNFPLVLRCLNELGFRWPDNHGVVFDRLWIAGDIIDRGPASIETLGACLHNPAIEFCVGNHDVNGLLASHDIPYNRAQWPFYGGEKYSKLDRFFLKSIFEPLKAHPAAISLTINEHNLGITHAGIPVDDWDHLVNLIESNRLTNENKMQIIDSLESWSKPRFISNRDAVLHGHVYASTSDVVRGDSNQLWLDGGMDHGRACRVLQYAPGGNLLGLFNHYEFSFDSSGRIEWLTDL
ncbi:metallophosphoesterase [Vibrio maritimus]|uniref:metallophosphoesterase n=1 Tax=Vibrio maritimus TaxID=990268 RepID=UPI0040692428